MSACGSPSPTGPGPLAGVILDAVPYEGGVPDATSTPSDATVGRQVLYVSPEGVPDADGTRTRPLRGLPTALAAARSGDLIVLLAGEYPALQSAVPSGLELLGLDALAVRLAGPIQLASPGVSLRSLTVVGGVPCARIAADATIDDLHFTECPATGLLVETGAVAAREVRVSGAGGLGVHVTGGVVDLESLTVEGARGGGLRLSGGEVTGSDIMVTGVTHDVEGVRANGVEVEGGRASLTRVTIGEVGDRGVRVAQGATATLTELRVIGPVTDGLAILSGADATVDVFDLAGAGNVGVSVSESRAALSRGRINGGARAGALISKSNCDVNGLVVEDAPERGIVLLLAEGKYRGLVVRRAGNVGLQITDARGALTVSESRFEDCGVTGIGVFGPAGGPILLEDVVVRGTRPGGDAELAEGLHLYETTVELAGLESTGNAGAGVLVEKAQATLEGGLLDQNGGPGLVAVDSVGGVELRDVVARGNHGAGLLVIGGPISTTSCRVEATRPAEDGTADGVELLVGAVAEMAGDVLTDNAGNGLYLFGDARASVTDFTSTENGAYGAFVACDDSELNQAGRIDLSGNSAGERNFCP